MTTDPDIRIDGWREAGTCFDRTDVDFFPEPDDSTAVAVAVSMCASCPVAAECLTWAIDTDQREGIWGGYPPAERRTIRRRWLEEIRRAS
jgi:WhiB family transcriptional regulator, redox-sensing transcriptional regulator